jgi:hypothetical protein
MLAMALESNATQRNHLVITLDFLESLLQNLDRILGVTGKILFKCAGDASRRFDQTIAFRIVAGPSDNGSQSSLHLGSVRPAER